MSREGDLMRRAIKRILAPALQAHGFVARGPGHQRVEGPWLDLLSLQYWKYGGEFVLEFARRARGPLQTSWGPLVAEEDLDVAYVNPLDRARLRPTASVAGPSLQGFHFAGFGEDPERYLALATEAAALLPQVDAWLRDGHAGPGVRPLRAPD